MAMEAEACNEAEPVALEEGLRESKEAAEAEMDVCQQAWHLCLPCSTFCCMYSTLAFARVRTALTS